ncbi:MAG: 1-acyl-sn-glycerol-3-phosphate acyltransferase [Deltaproteobacteria bacterium]|nr:1-acyl-sn-glycerol-3-phosphate acyltransferase [Deltaproteobacteria bacterium]
MTSFMDLLILLIAFSYFSFIIPMLRYILRRLLFLINKLQFSPFNPLQTILGRIDNFMGPFRETVLPILLSINVLVYGIGAYGHWHHKFPKAIFVWLVFLLIAWASRYRRLKVQLELAEFLNQHPNCHPEDFFKIYYAQFAVLPSPPSTWNYRTITLGNVDFRTGRKPKQTFLPFFISALQTSTLASMAILALTRRDEKTGVEIFDALSRMWGAIIALNIKAKISTLHANLVPPLEGKTLLVYNHRSYLDFGLSFFALGLLKTKTDRFLRSRFITAKDHFVDNPILYSWLKVGKAIEKAGMIFVDRKKGKGWEAMLQAAESLVEKEVEIAVYPQGTRANACIDLQGERRDASYYTTFRPDQWQAELGHLKMGTATLILDAAMALASWIPGLPRTRIRGQARDDASKLNILVVGIEGTGIAGPKGSFRCQTETEINFVLSEPWHYQLPSNVSLVKPTSSTPKLEAEKNYQTEIKKINFEINARLLKVLNWHEKLIVRACEEMGPSIENFLLQCQASHQSLPFILLDRIFSLPPSLLKSCLLEFTQLNQKDLHHPAWQALLQKVSLAYF